MQEKGQNMSEFKVIETQEELDAIIKARISREREHFKDYEHLKKQVLNLQTENNELRSLAEQRPEFEKQISELQTQIKGYETEKIKTNIAVEYGLPINLASRLSGENEDTIRQDAQNLAGLFKPQAPLPNPENKQILNTVDQGLSEMLNGLF